MKRLSKSYIIDNITNIEKETGVFSYCKINNEDISKLEKKVYAVKCIEILINVITYLSGMLEDLEGIKEENEKLKLENALLRDRCTIAENTIKEYNGHYATKAALTSGKKLAYKEEISNEDILEMLRTGENRTSIARKFGISRGTVYNRIKKIREAGIEI